MVMTMSLLPWRHKSKYCCQYHVQDLGVNDHVSVIFVLWQVEITGRKDRVNIVLQTAMTMQTSLSI